MLSIVRFVENRKPNNIGKSETSKIGRCLRTKLRMKCGRVTLPPRTPSRCVAPMPRDRRLDLTGSRPSLSHLANSAPLTRGAPYAHAFASCVSSLLKSGGEGERFSPFSKTFEKRPFSSVFSHFPTFRLLSGGEYRPSELG